jgi:F0F1-type ATP synthase assembly protein I
VNPYDRLKRQATKVQLAMVAITVLAVLLAFLLAGFSGALAALIGGTINIVSVFVYSRLARVDPRHSAQQALNRHLLAEAGKVGVSLLGLLVCFFVRGVHLPALLLAFIASLLAYWIALIFYKN